MSDYIDPADLPEEWTPAILEFPDGGRRLYYVSAEGCSARSDGRYGVSWRVTRPRVVCLLEPVAQWQPMPEDWWRDGEWERFKGATVKNANRTASPAVTAALSAVDAGSYVYGSGKLIGHRDYGDWFYDPTTLPEPDPDADLIEAIRSANTDEDARALITRLRGEAS